MTDWDDDEWVRKYCVYRIFDARDRLLYVGCTEDVQTRIYMHRATHTMVDAHLIHRHYHHHTSELIGTSLAEARAAERKAIKEERPLLNRQHNPTRWRRHDGVYLPVDMDTLDAHKSLCEPPPRVDSELADWFRSFASAPEAT